MSHDSYEEAESNYMHDLEAYAKKLHDAIKAIKAECDLQYGYIDRSMIDIENICDEVLEPDFFPHAKPDDTAPF